MSRQARAKSGSGIYHIILRGINRQQIFEEAEDSERFLEILKECKEKSEFKVYAYCFMENHLHLLIKEEKEKTELIFKRLGARYVYWYNWKYRRRGHLFQDRYKSESVEDDKHFLTVLRYIHQNPIKANLCKRIEDYKLSSYNDYINSKEEQVTDIDFALGMLSKDEFIRFHNEKNYDECMEIEENDFRLSDEEAKKIIFKVAKCKSVADFQDLEMKKRDKYIKKLKEKGLSIRQISRLTGISFGVVRKT